MPRVTDPVVDIFDRERAFIDRSLSRIVRDFPQLRVVFEHITTRDAADFVLQATDRIGATITAHHLLYNRNAMLAGGIRPHYYCLPVLKREEHRQALVQAATGGNPRFFLGTDSAPHPHDGQRVLLRLRRQLHRVRGDRAVRRGVRASAGALERLEAFAAFYGADFYRLPRNEEKIRLIKQPWTAPAGYDFGEGRVVPLRAGEPIGWQLAG